jgi:hypothetical protein
MKISEVRKQQAVVCVKCLSGCARCGHNHRNLKFKMLAFPCGDLTHWAKCPRNGQPIIMKITD